MKRTERIEWELEQLRANGMDFEEPTITDGLVTVPVFVEVEGARHRLEVDFFEFFPYFRFEVRAPSLTLSHHQHPFGKNLCLMPRGTQHWEVGRSLASYLEEQLPKVLATAAQGPNELRDEEDPQAEPVTTYFPSMQGSVIFFDGGWTLPTDFTMGRLTLLREPSSRGAPFRGVANEVSTIRNDRILLAPPHLPKMGQRVEGYVVRLSEPILEEDPGRLYDRLRRIHLRGFREPSKVCVIAVVVPEEHAWRTTNGQGWLFIVKERGEQPYFARPMRAGAADLRARAPELTGLASRAIAQFGLGCIGSVSAIEFAKAGLGSLRILDHDVADAGTGLRWYLGLPAAGHLKTNMISQFIRSHYPLTDVAAAPLRLGSTSGERIEVAHMVEGASLVYDATAEPGVSYFLADLARHRGIPYVGVSGTQGGWGGIVIRLRDGGACWYCLERAKQEGLVPPPPADTRGVVQPAGCADPTFTGAGFDLSTVALAGVRAAVSTLLEGQAGYPSAPSDVTVIAFRDAQGYSVQPQFTGVNLTTYPDCTACSNSGSR